MMVCEIDLVSAAARLRVPWHKAYRYVLTGRLTGERRDGRWFVDLASIDRLEREKKDGPFSQATGEPDRRPAA